MDLHSEYVCPFFIEIIEIIEIIELTFIYIFNIRMLRFAWKAEHNEKANQVQPSRLL